MLEVEWCGDRKLETIEKSIPDSWKQDEMGIENRGKQRNRPIQVCGAVLEKESGNFRFAEQSKKKSSTTSGLWNRAIEKARQLPIYRVETFVKREFF